MTKGSLPYDLYEVQRWTFMNAGNWKMGDLIADTCINIQLGNG